MPDPEPSSSQHIQHGSQDKAESKIVKHEWFLRTFRSRERTEELLKPELEAGNITYNDYASAVAFLPHIGPRLLPYFFATAVASGVVAIGMFKKPPWPRQKLLLYGFGSAFMSQDFAEVGVWTMRQRWMQRLENQRGFEIAMDNIETRLKTEKADGMRKRFPTSIPSSRPTPPPPKESVPEESPTQWTWPSPDQAPSKPIPSQFPQPTPSYQYQQEVLEVPSEQPLSRWDEIRRNQQQSLPQKSAWDRVRENQVRDPGAAPDRRGQDSRWSDADRERAVAQTEFDRLLESERRIQD